MTERPEGAPGASPDEPDAAPEAETETGAPEAAAAETEAPEAAAVETEAVTADSDDYDPEGDTAEGDEIEAELDADEDADDEEFEDETVAPLGAEPVAASAAAAGATGARRRQAPPASVQRAPTQSELAVRVTDNASRFFVIGTVIVFVAILAWGLVAGTGGLLTTTPAPTVAPSISAEVPAAPS